MSHDTVNPTREKILQAAADVFGKQGYKPATVRNICQQAGVNVAAVNYYFGGKAGLYREVARGLIAETFDRFPVTAPDASDLSPEQRLGFFVKGILTRLLAPGGLSGYPGKGQLVAREMAEPSEILDDIVDEFIRPTALALGRIVQDLLGPDASGRDVMRCQISIIGQCFHYALARPIVTRLFKVDPSRPPIVEELADHVTRFSLAGLDGVRRHIAQRRRARTTQRR
jgi:AcrR family transcriptional regulator